MNQRTMYWSVSFAFVVALGAGVAACGGDDDGNGDGTDTGTVSLTQEEFAIGTEIYFDLCAGCHGTLRGGATGPALTPVESAEIGTGNLKHIIAHGTNRGMPGYAQAITDERLEILAKFLQLDPPSPPYNSIADIAATAWATPYNQLAVAPAHDHNTQDLLVVTLRDTGENAIVDQARKEVVEIVNTGYATHVTKFSNDGRFALTQGRDGLTSKIDLYTFEIVGEATIGMDARDVAVSTYEGYEDKYVIAGAYWPPQAVILDFETMMPLKIVNLQGIDTDGNHQVEARAAAIYATKLAPVFIVAAKETGMVWLIDYTDLRNLRVDIIATDMYLHDGFFDQSGRYFMIAANQRNKMQVVDVVDRKWVAEIVTGGVPHPGPGAVWHTDQYGWVAATTHLGEGKVTIWGTDPEFPQHQWKIVGEVNYATSGGLFIRTHENTPYVWFDSPLSTGEGESGQIYVMDKQTFEIVETLRTSTAPGALALHPEPNKDGTEMWVSIWDTKGVTSTDNALVAYDSQTLQEVARMTNDDWPGLITPTGKFQSYLRAGK